MSCTPPPSPVFFLTSSFTPGALPSATGRKGGNGGICGDAEEDGGGDSECEEREDAWLQLWWRGQGGVLRQVRMNHSTASTKAVYAAALVAVREMSSNSEGKDGAGKVMPVVSELDLVPFYWSAGLVAHPLFVEDSQRYLGTLALSEAYKVRLLQYLPQSFAAFVMEGYAIYASGSNYSGITLNVYKSPNGKVVMSSFDRYNVNLRSYQQNPWMVNFAGAPLWSQSGRCGRKVLPGFNSYCPAVSQTGCVMAIAYAAPSSREGFIAHSVGLYDNTSFVVWPHSYFEDEWRVSPTGEKSVASEGIEEEGEGYLVQKVERADQEHSTAADGTHTIAWGKGCWWIARREGNYIGLLCSHATTEEGGGENAPAGPTARVARMQMRPLPSPSSSLEEKETYVETPLQSSPFSPKAQSFPETSQRCPQQRFCSAPNHTWVVGVGDTSEYANVSSFIRYCTEDVIVQQGLTGGVYAASVTCNSDSKECSGSASLIQLEVQK